MSEQKIREKTAAMRTGQLKMKRDREYWTDEERQKLKDEFFAGRSYNEIALELGRSETAIQQQIEQMQLYVKPTRASRKQVLAPQKAAP